MSIYGLRPRPCGHTEYFSSDLALSPGDYVLANSAHGQSVAQILTGPMTALAGASEKDLPAIIRAATSHDMEIFHANREISKKAKAFCKSRIAARKLDMKLVDVEVFHDRSKYVFYFTSPTRIDFRELVKDLVAEYRSRIELRQIGVRHETQMLGAIGNCGQVCCCRRHLRQFAPVTIRMAKDQNLFLNPAKISGICGRLLCCLSYEQDTYEDFYKKAPRMGRKYQSDEGLLKVLAVNMFKNTVTFVGEKGGEREVSLDEWQKLRPQRPKNCEQEHDEGLGTDWS